jgi:hypothetical protein
MHTVTLARQAFDDWLNAVAHDNATTMLARSQGVAAAFGWSQLVTDQTIRSEGGTTTGQTGSERLRPIRFSAATLTFAGEADLRESVTAHGTHFTSVDRITGPIRLTLTDGQWKVVDVGLDGKPITYYPESVTQTVRGARLTIAFILTTVGGTSALVGLTGSTGGQALYLTRLSLTLATGQTETGQVFLAHGTSTGTFAFPRVDGRPTRLIANFHDAHGAAVDFTFRLVGRAS